MRLSFWIFVFVSQKILLEAWKEFWIIKSAVGLVKSHHFLKVCQTNILYSKNTLSRRYVLFCIIHTSLPMLLLFSCSVVSDSVSPWIEPRQAPLCPWDFPARILEWVAISFSREPSQPRDRAHVCSVSSVAGGYLTAESSGLLFLSMFSQIVVSLL